MRFVHIRGALTLVKPLGLAAAIFSSFVLGGYAFGIEALYRPLSNGPATHPLSALAMLLLGVGLGFWRPRRASPRTQWLAGAAMALGLLRLLDISLGTDLLGAITPFSDTVARERFLEIGRASCRERV